MFLAVFAPGFGEKQFLYELTYRSYPLTDYLTWLRTMDLNLEDKVVLVTGSGEGIGRRTVLTFAEEGANVAINDIIGQKAKNVAREARSLGVSALPLTGDVSEATEVDGMVKKFLLYLRE